MEDYGATEDTAQAGTDGADEAGISKADQELVGKITARIKADKEHHKDAFDEMKRDMKIARRGADEKWPKKYYTANITGRHINQKVAALYAKNPKAIARRRERLDFAVWDENEQSLMLAVQTVAMATQPQVDPLTGAPVPPDPMMQMDPAFQQAMAVVQDYEQGMLYRRQVHKIGKTLELLFNYFTKEQVPNDFKTSMKGVVRRTSTCKVGYVKIGFQREFDSDPVVVQRLADFQRQLEYIQNLGAEAQDPDDPEHEVKKRELQAAMASLQEQQYVLVREGLVFDFPEATRVIPDRITRSLVGFVGARWITVEHYYTPTELKAQFGVDPGEDCKKYNTDGSEYRDDTTPGEGTTRSESYVCVWEHFDRQAGVVYLVCDGYKGFLRPPGPPEVYVEDFWPIYALTFNEVEDPGRLFPPSDVELMRDMQDEYNRARQGKREHRQAARPRFATPKGALDDADKARLVDSEPFEVVEMNLATVDMDVRKALQPIPVPGVDPNLYDTGEIFADMQLVIGAQEATFGAVAKATATETSIAESSRIASVDSNIDDLDAFLTRIARASGQILLREMSEQTVKEIVGPGAVWPQMTLDQIAAEIFLEIEAGSSGRPNQAAELQNWERMLPFLVQMPNIVPTWLARETLRRLDDRMDLTEATSENTMAIVAQNRLAGAAPAPGALPEDQGGAGAQNAQVPGGPVGSAAAFGSNQV